MSNAALEAAQEEVKADMTPMIDCVFLMIIFFICIDFKVLESKLPAYLPKDKGSQSFKVDPVQQFDGVDHRAAVQRGKHLQVLPGGQAGEFCGQFETHADLLVVVPAPLVQGSTEHTHVSLVSVQQTGQHALNGGLSRTGRAEEPEDLAGPHGEIHVLHRVLV